jgi:ribonuclease R
MPSIELKRLLRELEGEGWSKNPPAGSAKGVLPPVAVLQVLPPDAAGDLYAEAAGRRGR